MHLGIIKINNQTIYVDYEKNTIINYYKTFNKKIITNNYFSALIKELITCHKPKFLYKNIYEAYLDEETGYKHFYQNNQEDYEKFFKENGQNAILCINNVQKDNIKIYAIKGCLICLNITLLLTLQSSINQVFITNQNINYTNNQLEKSNEIKLTSSDLKQYIINSKNLSNQDKKLLINEKFFEDLTETQVTEDRYLSLDEKMTDITITVGIDDKNNENLLGWYSDLYPNIIHLANEEDNNTKIHEFIHLMQSFNEYSYIKEASASLISSEYYNVPNITYTEAVSRLQFLMELIGEETIWNLNFSGTTTDFENKIYDILPKEDANELLKLFRENPAYLSEENQKTLNNKIDKYLYQIYNTLTNEETELSYLYNETKIIFDTYNIDKNYFNNKNNDFSLKFSKIIPLEEALEKNIVKISIAQKKYIEKSEVDNLKKQDIPIFTEYNILDNKYEIISQLNEASKLEDYVYNTSTGENYDIQTAQKLGLIECKYWYYIYVPADINKTYETPLIIEPNLEYDNITVKEVYPIEKGYEEGKHNIIVTYETNQSLIKNQTKTK